MDRIVGDFETRGRLDLGRAGPWTYAEDPLSDVVCLGLWVKGQVRMWIPPWVRKVLPATVMAQLLPVQMWMVDRDLTELAQDMEFEAHNVEFERAIWHHIMHQRYGFPDLILEKCHCTAARAAIQSLPRALKKVGAILGLNQQKDDEGHRAMLRVCKPRAPRKEEKEAFPDWETRIFWEESPEYLGTVIKYCAQDIRTEVDLSNHLQDISPNERKIWLADQRINQRGFFCDAPGARAMLQMVAEEKRKLNTEFQMNISGGEWGPNQVAKLKTWLAEQGYDLDDLAKGTVQEVLAQENIPPDVRRALEIRADISKTSTAKYQALLSRRGLDGRVRSTLLYHGAGTGRWSGKAFQPHNLPARHLLPQSELCIDLVTAHPDPRAVDVVFGSPMWAASSCIRPMLMAPPGMDLLWADYSSVEGRALAWLAGEEHVLRAYRENQDLYKIAAGHAFGVDPASIDKEDPRRQIGKVIELECVGRDQLVTTDRGLVPIQEVKLSDKVFDGVEFVSHGGVVCQGVKEVVTYAGLTATPDHVVYADPWGDGVREMMPLADAIRGRYRLSEGEDPPDAPIELPPCPVYDILNCGPRNRFVVSGVLVHNCGYQGWIGAYESMAKNYAMKPLPEEQVKELILAWRESRPATTRLWREIEAASIMAVRNPGQICRYRLIQMLFHGDYLRVRLPSGRLLWYYHPIVKKSVTPWGQEKDMLWYMGEDSMTKQWKLISLYGGKAAENFVQGICRDLMAEAILRAEDQRYWVVMHVHDEIITEIPEGWGDLTYFENLMSTVPDWAVGLPIAAKGFRAKRYQKK